MKILYSINYMLRDLYVIEHQSEYLMVYRSSGLNPGRKGRILPFAMLATPSRPTVRGDTPGYIYKEFYFGNHFISHDKQPSNFGPGIAEFLEILEDFLADKFPPEIDCSHIKTYSDVLPIAKAINIELSNAIKGLQPFDWKNLIKDEQ